MQVLYQIRIVEWDYNDHFAKWEYTKLGPVNDPCHNMTSPYKDTLVNTINKYGVDRRVYEVIKTYFNG